MRNRVISGLATGTSEAVSRQILEDLGQQLGDRDRPALVIAFASTAQPLDELLPALDSELPPGTTLLGASTAGEFTEKGDIKQGTAYLSLVGDFEVFAGMGTGLAEDAHRAVSSALDGQPPSLEGYAHRAAILLLDPLAGHSEEAVLIASGLLGPHTSLAGGAAGDDLHMSSTRVGVGSRTAGDAVVVASIFSNSPLGFGVDHGHAPMSGSLKVTRAEDNVVHEIDGRPAWEVWKEATREAAAREGIDPDRLSAEEEGAFLLRYEAGLATGETYKIRAPLTRDPQGSISFACGIPEGSVFQITESSSDRQVASAKNAARQAREGIQGPVAGALVFDCICRNLILGNRFADAVEGITQALGDVPIAGFETYGEIALTGGDLSGFHNTTTVVLAFPER